MRESFLDGNREIEGLRDEVFSSWQRSLAWSVDSSELITDFNPNFDGDERLLDAANSVLEDATARLGELGVVFMVSDASGRILGRWTSERPILRWLDSVNASAGHTYSEDVVGTNAIGTAIELGRTTRLDGHEHFIDAFRDFTCVGVPLRDPISQRLRGILDVTTRVASGNQLITLVAEQTARSIELRLSESRSLADHILLQRFIQARHRSSGVIAINPRTMMSDPRAARLVGHLSQSELWEHAASVLNSSIPIAHEFVASNGDAVYSTASVVLDGDDPVGVLLRIRESSPGGPRGRRRPAPRPLVLSENLLGESRRHTDAVRQSSETFSRGALVLRGGPGTGKTTLARALHLTHGSGMLRVSDSTLADSEGLAAWLRDLRASVAEGSGTLVVQHVDSLAPAAEDAVARIMATSIEGGWSCVLTVSETHEIGPALASLVGGAIVQIPNLDARENDIEILVSAFAQPSVVAPEVLQLLRRIPWLGNVAELKSQIEMMRLTSSGVISLQDVPPELRKKALSRNLSRLERIQVREMLDALSEADGNRLGASKLLGISRSTLYRKLRDAGIDLDKTAF